MWVSVMHLYDNQLETQNSSYSTDNCNAQIATDCYRYINVYKKGNQKPEFFFSCMESKIYD